MRGRQKWLKQVLVSVRSSSSHYFIDISLDVANNFVSASYFKTSMFGLQLVWSTEMAYASPYLLSLGGSAVNLPLYIEKVSQRRIHVIHPRHFNILPGLSKSGMSAVFLAGPLSGKASNTRGYTHVLIFRAYRVVSHRSHCPAHHRSGLHSNVLSIYS